MPFEVTEQNPAALEPLFKPWEEPDPASHPQFDPGGPAIIHQVDAPAKYPSSRGIRAEVDAWRRGGYGGIPTLSHPAHLLV